MSSHKLEDLDESAMWSFSEFELNLTVAGYFFVRACTYRSDEEQAQLYALGRTMPGRIVTWCKAGQSAHNIMKDGRPASLAADYYPLLHGKIISDQTDKELEIWKNFGLIAVDSGLIWGGNWKGKKMDRPHFQLASSIVIT